MIRRQTNSRFIERVCNHPEVIRHVARPETERIDLSHIAANPANYILTGIGGGIFFVKFADGGYEAHAQFLPNCRGIKALTILRECLQYMFTQTDCMEVHSRTPADNLPARVFVRQVGAQAIGQFNNAWPTANGPVDLIHYVLTYQDWVLTQGGSNAC